MLYILIAVLTLVCAFQAIRCSRLINSAIWLAGASALTALILYLLGAVEVAVIELSVGAGLVTILFVFAINIAGEEEVDVRNLLPRPLALGLVVLAALLIGWFILPFLGVELPTVSAGLFFDSLWNDRSMDVLLQVILIFAGVVTLIGLLAEEENTRRNKNVRLAGEHITGEEEKNS